MLVINMKVYRVIEDVNCSDRNGNYVNEYQDYLKGIISIPKKSFNDGMNTHEYKKETRYLHFFHYYEGALEYVSGIPSMGWNGRCFIVSYDIPDEILDRYRGLGIYPGSIHSAIPLLEYAIPFDELNNEFITGEIREYNLRDEWSEEYKRYMQGEYQRYVEALDENNKKFIKTYLKIASR